MITNNSNKKGCKSMKPFKRGKTKIVHDDKNNNNDGHGVIECDQKRNSLDTRNSYKIIFNVIAIGLQNSS